MVISHQACGQGWKNHTKELQICTWGVSPGISSILSTQQWLRAPSREYITISDNALPNLCPYEYFHSNSQRVPVLNAMEATDLEGEWISTACPWGSSSLLSHACSQQYSLPALRPRQELCALLTEGQSRRLTVTTAPSSWRRFYILACRLPGFFPHPLTVCPELHPVPQKAPWTTWVQADSFLHHQGMCWHRTASSLCTLSLAPRFINETSTNRSNTPNSS